MGIEPTRQRRYLLHKREKFRRGIYGPGGDLDHVVDGAAQLRVVDVPIDSSAEGGGESESGEKSSMSSRTASAALSPGMKRVILNLHPEATEFDGNVPTPLKKFAHMKIYNGSKIRGPFLKPLKGANGSAALIKNQEGMWEDRQGHKVDGGQRRQAEVRAKKRSEERSAAMS